MGSWIKVVEGIIRFVFGIVFTILTAYMIPPIITTLEGVTGAALGTTITGIFWMGLITCWIMALIIWPGGKILEGIQQE